MPTFRGSLVPLALLLSAAVSNAQFVAFNDYVPGSGTAPNTTIWNVNGDAPGTTGPLKDINTGLDLPVILTTSKQGNVVAEGTQANPAPGTPAYLTFNGFVDFTGNGLASLAVTG